MFTPFYLVLVLLVLDPVKSQKCEDFKDWGFVCQDCQTMVTCVNTMGTWTPITLGKCDEKQKLYCNRSSRNCSTIKDCGTTVAPAFICNSEGIFPDPIDCQTYYACTLDENSKLKQTPSKMQCQKPFAFLPNSSDCSANSSDSICQSRQFKCDKIGDKASWPGNANIFYICVQSTEDATNGFIYPLLFRCPAGETFSGEKCTSSATPTPPTTTTPTPKPPSDQPFKCTKRGLFANPTNCTEYYYCDNNNRTISYSCPGKSFFNSNQKICVPGTCPQQ